MSGLHGGAQGTGQYRTFLLFFLQFLAWNSPPLISEFVDLLPFLLDAGTAIKCDLVEGGHTFRGGSISPGLAMRFQALHTFTGRLPLVAMPVATAHVPLTGDDTQAAIRSGVLNGAVAEVQGMLTAYAAQFPQLTIVLAGGDAAFFHARLKGTIFVIPELVLIGLHRILVHHVST